jgi:TonB family protein
VHRRARVAAVLLVGALAACGSATTPEPVRRGALPTSKPYPLLTGDPRAALRARGFRDSVYGEEGVEQPAVAWPGSVSPRYPATLRNAGVQGDVLAQFVVDTVGWVMPGTLRILRSSDTLFAQAVHTVIDSLRFTPARRAGRPVFQLVQQPFQFRVER